jgi:hypothetical protein
MFFSLFFDLCVFNLKLDPCSHRYRDPWQENESFIKSALAMYEVQVVNVEDGPPQGDKKKADLAAPGKPSYHFYVNK